MNLNLTFQEWLVLGPLILLLVVPLWTAYVDRPRLKFWKPTTMVCLTFLYYCVLGPLLSIYNGDTVVVYKDARPFYILGWGATLVGMIAYFVGYHLGGYGGIFSLGGRFRGNPHNLMAISMVFLAFGILGLLYIVQAQGLSLTRILMPGSGSARIGAPSETGTFGAYIMRMSTFIAGYVLILVALSRGMKMRILLPVMGLMFVFLMYLAAIGFRGSIVETLLGFGTLLYILKRRRPTIPTLTAAGFAILFLSGVILYTRSYFGGLNFDRLKERSAQEILEGGFNDSMIFGAMSLCMDAVPERFHFHGFESVWLTVTMPIPRQLWPGKPTSKYLVDIQRILGEGEEYDTVGQAIPNIGEYYMAFGWPGVFVGMFLFGLFCRKFWRWFIMNRNDVLATVAYCSFFAWIFAFLHRGYLPQTFTDFCFSVVPILIIRHFVGTIPLYRVLPKKDQEPENESGQAKPSLQSTKH